MSSDGRQYIVKVGANGETASPAFQEFAGHDHFGPFTEKEATAFAAEVRTAFEALAMEDPQGFVYGEVSAVVIPLRARRGAVLADMARHAAANWWLDREGREEG